MQRESSEHEPAGAGAGAGAQQPYGPLSLVRMRKADGRALVVFTRGADGDPAGSAADDGDDAERGGGPAGAERR
jgi:hypothetical protein